MAGEKGLGSKILGIFVETGEGNDQGAEEKSEGQSKGDSEGGAAPGGKTAAQEMEELVAASSRAAAATGRAPGGAASPAGAPGSSAAGGAPGAIAGATSAADFEAVFLQAGMDAAELDRVKKAEELLKNLPEATPLPVRRQIVEASLKAFGVEVAKIAASTQNHQRALDTYLKVHQGATAKAIDEAKKQVAALEERILALKSDVEKKSAALAGLDASVTARKAELQKVLEFFRPTPG